MYRTTRRLTFFIFLWLALLASEKASAAGCSTKRGGSTGIWRLESAQSCHDHLVTLALFGDYASMNFTDAPSGHYVRLRYHAQLVWFPQARWQVGVGGDWTQASLRGSSGSADRFASGASVFAKYSQTVLRDDMSLGLTVTGRIPAAATAPEAGTEPEVLTFVPGAFALTPQALFTWRPVWLEASFGVGYSIDHSAHLLARAPSEEQAASFDINSRNALLLQLGAQHTAWTARYFDLTPFVEISAALTNKGGSSLLGFGIKNEFSTWPALGIIAGAELEMSGVASQADGLAPVSRWQGFVQVSANFDRVAAAHHPSAAGSTRAMSRTVRGVVVNALTGEEISGATLTLGGYATVLSTDLHRGTFETWPLDKHRQTYVFTARASGFTARTLSYEMIDEASSEPFKIALMPVKGDETLRVRGFLRDKESGLAASGHIYFVRDGVSIAVGKDGRFDALIHVGSQEIVVTAPHYADQKRIIEGVQGETLILNFEMTRANRALKRTPKP